jgi:paraquat-inducible protein B
MSKRANPAWVGAFVVCAIAICAAAVVLFGSGHFFRSMRTFVIFFPGSVNGLDKGAPVKFRGVTIGTVTDIRIRMRGLAETGRIPVLIEVDRERVHELGGSDDTMDDKRVNELIYDYGMRAQLQQQSFITGLLYVALDLFPDSKVDLVLPPGSAVPYTEIPCLPTTLEQAQAKFEQILDRINRIDFDVLGKSVNGALEGISRLANSPQVYANLEALHGTLGEIRGAAADLRARIPALSNNVSGTTDDLRSAVQRLQASLERFDSLIDPSAPLLGGLAATIGEVGDAARAVRQLAEQLDRNPSVLLTGKKEP